MKSILAYFLPIVLSSSLHPAYGQTDDLRAAIEKYEQYDRSLTLKNDTGVLRYLLEAKVDMDLAMTEKENRGIGKAWVYQGHIYYQILTNPSPKAQPYRRWAVETAFKSYRKAIELDTTQKYLSKVKDGILGCTDYFFLDGKEAYEAGNYKKALRKFEYGVASGELYNSVRGDGEAYDFENELINAFYSAFMYEHFEKTVAYGSRLIVEFDAEPSIYIMLSDLFGDRDDIQQQWNFIRMGRQKYPEDQRLMRKAVDYFIENGRLNEAIPLLKEALNDFRWIASQRKELWYQLGEAYLGNEQKKEAEKAYLKAVAIDSMYLPANERLSQIYMEKASAIEDSTAQYTYYRLALPYLEKAYLENNQDLHTTSKLRQLYLTLGLAEKAAKLE